MSVKVSIIAEEINLKRIFSVKIRHEMQDLEGKKKVLKK